MSGVKLQPTGADGAAVAVSRYSLGLTLVTFGLYAVLSIARNQTYRSTGFDLGLFDQVVWHLANFEAPASSVKGLGSIFGDHFSPALGFVAPVRMLWPSPNALLVTQAALVAGSGIPVYLFARARFDEHMSLAICFAYLLSGSLQAGVWFDFHEMAFAPPLLAMSVLYIDRGQISHAVLAALALLLVKEDLSFTVAAIGVYMIFCGHRSWGVATGICGVLWYAVITTVVIPAAAGGVSYRYWSYDALGSGVSDALQNCIRRPWIIFDVATNASEKLRSIAYLFGAWLALPLASPLLIIVVPLLAERFLSSNAAYWSMQGHYSLAVAPVLALAAVDGLWRLSRRIPPVRLQKLSMQVAGLSFVAIAVVCTASFPASRAFSKDSYRVLPAYRGASGALAVIPKGASVAATNRLLPHLADRRRVEVFSASTRDPDFIVAATSDPEPAGFFPNSSRDALRALVEQRLPRYVETYREGGVIVLRRRTGR